MTRKVLVSSLLILLTLAALSLAIHPTAAQPVYTLSVDATSLSTADVSIQTSATNSRTFRVGVVINASATNPLPNIAGWQFALNYNSTLLVPQADPSAASPYPDGAGNTLQFGTQLQSGGTPSWGARVTAGQAFGGVNILFPGKIFVFYAILAPNPAATISVPNLLANIAFELLNKTATPSPVTISDIIVTDFGGLSVCTCIPGTDALETIPNEPPRAAFTATRTSRYTFTFASTSTDTDGTIPDPAGYFWDFDDGTQDLGASGSVVLAHDYEAQCTPLCPDGVHSIPGRFNVTLRVQDDLSATGSARDSTGSPIVNGQPSHTFRTIIAALTPIASFTFSPSSPAPGGSVSFDASASADPDGTIVDYSWNFGDGSPTGSGVTTSHSFATEGTFQVRLTVTGSLGTQGTQTRGVVVVSPNTSPTVDFTAQGSLFSAQPATLTIAASDPDGTIATVQIDWGDGNVTIITGTIQSVFHVYANPGSYTVTVTVTDNRGGTATKTSTVTVSSPPAEFPLPGGPIPYIIIAIAAAAIVALLVMRKRRATPASPASKPA